MVDAAGFKSPYPVVRDVAPTASEITPYDQQHFLTYARLIDAERGGGDWRDGAREILLCDIDCDVPRARRCWQSHLARAHWIVTAGLEMALLKG